MKKLTIASLVALTACGFGQSADPKHPAPLQSGENTGVIHSLVQIPQYYSVTLGPGKGTLTISFTSNGFPGTGGQIRLTLQSSKAKKDYSVTVASTQGLFGSSAAKVGQIEIPFDVASPNEVILRIDPPAAGLIVGAGRYTLKATGAAKFAPPDANRQQAVGTYRVASSELGEEEQDKMIKLLPGGTIESETGASGTWTLFDADSKTYVLKLGAKRCTMMLWPAVGFSKAQAGNPDLTLIR